MTLYLTSGTPMISAATSRSRIACNARPVRVRTRFLATSTAMPSRARQNRYVFWLSVTSNHSQWPSSAKEMTGSSSFHHLNSSGGKLRPTSGWPEISGKMRDRWMPMKTRPTVTMPR